MTERKLTPQERYAKKNLSMIVVRYKKEFVAEFKQACAALGVSQASIIKKTIEKAKEEGGI